MTDTNDKLSGNKQTGLRVQLHDSECEEAADVRSLTVFNV